MRSTVLHFSTGPLWVVLKLAENGSLLEYLESLRVGNVSYENVTKTTTATNLSYVEKLLFAHGIAEGMKHLADKKVNTSTIY